MSRTPALDGAIWADWAEVRVDLGTVSSWEPPGATETQWGGGTWGVDVWGLGYLTPAAWHDVTADVESLDLDTGRNGVDDPGDVGTCSVVLFDPAGAYAIGGARSALGDLLRVTTRHMASDTSRVVFYGKTTDAKAVGSFSEPTTSLKAIDMLGSVLSTDDTDPLPAQSTSERIGELLDRAAYPDDLRDLGADDPTSLAAVDKAGNRLDAARGAVSSAVGGSLWAAGDGTIRYRHGTFVVDPSVEPDYLIGTAPGYVCPSGLDIAEAAARVVNVYDWTSQDKSVTSHAEHADSIRRFGRNASVRTDLLNTRQDELDALVTGELARTALGSDQIDNCEIPIQDDTSAELVLVQIGELVDYSYTGAAPWGGPYLVGGYAQHLTPDEWTVHIRAYPAVVSAAWGVAQWGLSAWAA